MADLIPTIAAKYNYLPLERIDAPTGRVYKPVGLDAPAVPSVTNILAATKDTDALEAWKQRVGEAEAERIKAEAAWVGTQMHKSIECALAREPLSLQVDEQSLKGYEMGLRLINSYFPHLTEVWGSEVSLYYPGKYAGTTDLVGVYRGRPAIVDFKQSLKPKRRQYIEDYFHQLAAYAMAHDQGHGTDIQFGAVLIAVQDGTTQEFTTTGAEFARYKEAWMKRVEDFHQKKSQDLRPGS